MGTPVLPQFIEVFHLPLSRKKTVIGRFLKFAGHVHLYKNLPGNTFGLKWLKDSFLVNILSSISRTDILNLGVLFD